MRTNPTRRDFLRTAAALPAAAWLTRYHLLAAPEKGRYKIRDIQTMVFQGPDRNYTLVRIQTDGGPSGFGEGYGSPGVGVKEGVRELKNDLIGKDPLQIDAIYTGLGRRTDGSAHALMRAASGIEMALWDTAGKILGQPASVLLGGRFREKVRMYDHMAPRNMWDKASCSEWAQRVKADKAGFTCHKFGLRHTDPKDDHGRDLANRMLSSKEVRLVRQGFENCREAIGWDHDIMAHCHWEYDLRTSLQYAEAIESMKPVWLEDSLQVHFSESWVKLCDASRVPICTGENWMRRAEALPFVVNRGVDILHPDLRNSGGFLETKKMADLADLFGLPMANHNTGSIVNSMATVQFASSIRDYLACETICGKGDWMDDVILHDGPIFKNSYIDVPAKPGLGIELNPDVVKAHLATGEVWWG